MPDINTVVSVKTNITCKRGDTFNANFEFWQDTNDTDPIDITGNDYKMSVTQSYNKNIIINTFTVGNGFTIQSPNILKLGPYEFAVAGNYIYDLQCTYPNGDIQTLVNGALIVRDDVTV